ncbi:type IV secretion system DNA-binding domain-containing protein [Candidatus Peregrinibacteria bacterium]|nr:type IV secretion system DNA-binding domain-containing protein [Candidatus Peregrinibacteria bacterium]
MLVNLHETLHGEKIGFEIISHNQHVYFYIRIPNHLRELIEGQIYALYPDAEIIETKDYIKNETLQTRSLAAAYLSLKRSDIYPLKTFKDFDGDSLAGVLAILTKATDDEQIWIQMIVSPREDNWSLNFTRSWKIKTVGIKNLFRIKDYFKTKSKAVIKSRDHEKFEEKAKSHIFRASIKIAYISNTKEKALQKLGALARAFTQFNTIDFNQFQTHRVSNTKNFVEKYTNLQVYGTDYDFSAEETASMYHFPDPDTVPHIVHVMARKAEPPQDLPKLGAVDAKDVSFLGVTNYHNQNIKFGIKRNDRRRHLYIVGKSGTGKSKLLELLIISDILAGHGVGVLDPHGDLVDNVLKHIPKERMDDVIYFNPADSEYPVAFNPLEQVPQELRIRVTIGFIDIFKKLFGANWTDRLEHVLRYTTLALLDSPNTTILSILKMLSDKNYRQKIVANIEDSVIKNFWVNEFAAWSEKFDNEAIMPILNKVGQFVSTSLIRNIVGQSENKIDIRQMMDSKKILLMRISKGNLGEENAQLMGAMVVTKIQQAAMSRTDTPEDERKDFYLYCDEFQYFATDTFAEILSEARKYHLNLTMAHQYMGQLTDKVRTTTFGNVGSMINFRIGAEDAAIMAKEYTPVFEVRDIINLGVREFYLKMSVDGEIRDAFSGYTLSVPKPPEDHSEKIIEKSRKKYARPREEVERDLKAWDESAIGEEEKSPASAQLEENFDEPLI